MWTRNKPTIHGLYWLQRPGGRTPKPVRVGPVHSGADQQIWVWFIGEDTCRRIEELPGAAWMPIDVPPVPKLEYNLTIEIPDIFEGNLKDWEDTFFSFHSENEGEAECIAEVLSFCKGEGWDVEIRYIRESSWT